MSDCKICASPDRQAIEKAIADKVGYRKIEANFRGISRSAVWRHSKHMARLSPGAVAQSESQSRLRLLYSKVSRLLDRAMKKGDHRTSATLLNQLSDLEARLLMGEAKENSNPAIREVDEDGTVRVVGGTKPRDQGELIAALRSVYGWDTSDEDKAERIRALVCEIGWPKALEVTLTWMSKHGELSPALQRATIDYLEILEREEHQNDSMVKIS